MILNSMAGHRGVQVLTRVVPIFTLSFIANVIPLILWSSRNYFLVMSVSISIFAHTPLDCQG